MKNRVLELAKWLHEAYLEWAKQNPPSLTPAWKDVPKKDKYLHVAAKLLTEPPACLKAENL